MSSFRGGMDDFANGFTHLSAGRAAPKSSAHTHYRPEQPLLLTNY